MQIANDSLPPCPFSVPAPHPLPPSLTLTASGMQLINGVVFVGEGIMMGCGSYRALALQTVVGGLSEKRNRKPQTRNSDVAAVDAPLVRSLLLLGIPNT